MFTKSFSKPTIAILVFAAGILLTMTLSAALTWAGLEADFYGFTRLSTEQLPGLECPAIMTPRETGSLRVTINNTTQRTITPVVRIDTSTSIEMDSTQTQLSLQPGETRLVQQSISANNIDLGNFIFARVYRYPAYPLPPAEATCGVLIVNLPWLNGAQIYALWLVGSLLLTPLGLWLWSRAATNVTSRLENAVRALAAIALISLLVSALGIWVFGVLLLALSILLTIVVARFALAE